MSTEDDVRDTAAEPEFCSYADFGLAFFQQVVTVDRIRAGVAGLTGRPIDFGPIGVGPARIAKLTATGKIGDPVIARVADDEPLRFLLRIPVDLRFVVALPASEHRFSADVDVSLRLTARAGAPLRIIVDIDPPEKKDVQVTLRAEGIGSTVLRMISGMESEIKRFVARYIAREIAKPSIRSARDVDLIPYVNGVDHR